MTLFATTAERILKDRLGAPINPVQRGVRTGEDNDKVLGFALPNGRLLALNRKIVDGTHIWLQGPEPPALEGVTLRPTPPINANLNGRLAVLNGREAPQLEVENEEALQRLLEWCLKAGPVAGPSPAVRIDPATFRSAFVRFQTLIAANDQGHAFASFHEGIAAAWENYKPRLHTHGRTLLAAEQWNESQIGSGEILANTIAAIEIDDRHRNLTNNLTSWRNLYGHANRSHHKLLEAVDSPIGRAEFERALFDLFVGEADEGNTFGRLRDLTGSKYPLLGYLFFLKDMDRFMPIHPTGFDEAFRQLGIELKTLRSCSWENYARYSAALAAIRYALEDIAGLPDVRLVDAHSFCWLLVKLEDINLDDGDRAIRKGSDAGRILGARERSIAELKYGIIDTAKQSRGQTVLREVQMKLKELRMTEAELERFIRDRLALQEDRCALTGLPFQFRSTDGDPNLLPSPDRIDSGGHYEAGNLQLVCRFVNFWKSDQEDAEFRRLLALVRGNEGSLPIG